MKILVTGGCGYVGTVLCPLLLQSGYEVVVVDRLWFGNYLPKECQVIEGDVRDPQESWFEPKFDAIIHLAGVSSDPCAEQYPLTNYTINATGTALLAEMAKKKGIPKFILASTCSVYGFVSEGLSKENSLCTPKYPYGVSKLMAETAVLPLMDTYFGVLVLRKGTIGGYSPRMRYDLVINTMTKTALQEKKIVVKNASLWRPVIDIRDVARAYKTALESKDTWGVFNIIQGNYTILQIGQMVADTLNCRGYEVKLEVYDRFDVRNYRASGEHALDALGFQAEFSVRDTVNSLLDRIEFDGEIADFDNENYYQLQVMTRIGGFR